MNALAGAGAGTLLKAAVLALIGYAVAKVVFK